MSELAGKVGYEGDCGFWVFFNEDGLPRGLYESEEEALRASNAYFTDLNDEWELGPACGLEPEVCESCQ